MQADAISNKLKVLVGFRTLFVGLLFIAFLALGPDNGIFPYPGTVAYLIGLIYALNLLYLFLLRNGRVAPVLHAYTQLVLDAVIAVLFIVATGGIESWFTSILLLIVITSSVIISKKAGFIIATLSGILYGIAIDLQYFGVLHVSFSDTLTEKNFLYNLIINLSALYLTAFLAGHLVSGLEKAKRSLDEKSTDLDHLALFHRDVIENIPSGLFYADPSGNVRLFNRAAETILGISRQKATTMHVQELFPFVEFPLHPKRYMGTIDLQRGRMHIGMSIAVHNDNEDLLQGHIGTFQDLTNIVRLEQEIKRKEKFAVIGELSANIAHEIRNPLASIKGSIEMIREGRLRDADKEKLMNIALNEMTRLNNIITDFLSYSNPRPPSFRKHDIADILRNTVTLLKSTTADLPGIRIHEQIGSPLYAQIDGEKMRQVFWNLLTNAVQAIGEGGEVTLRTWESRGDIFIEIRDTGEGIRHEDMERIFYPFYTTKKDGTGLGLSIAYRIIEEHNGSIEVKSSSGEGAAFLIKLPETQYEATQAVLY